MRVRAHGVPAKTDTSQHNMRATSAAWLDVSEALL
jgi:hypothetical protein